MPEELEQVVFDTTRKARECFEVTKSFEPICKQVCTDEEYAIISKAFFEKEKNLSENQIPI